MSVFPRAPAAAPAPKRTAARGTAAARSASGLRASSAGSESEVPPAPSSSESESGGQLLPALRRRRPRKASRGDGGEDAVIEAEVADAK